MQACSVKWRVPRTCRGAFNSRYEASARLRSESKCSQSAGTGNPHPCNVLACALSCRITIGKSEHSALEDGCSTRRPQPLRINLHTRPFIKPPRYISTLSKAFLKNHHLCSSSSLELLLAPRLSSSACSSRAVASASA